MELLAPVGTFETFFAALDAGADAVYVGAPDINARSLTRDLRFEELGAMVAICREQGKKIYIAANSLLREQDLPQLINTLAYLEELKPDALIVQDMGLIRIINVYFPNLPLHASTLMAAHNSDCVRMFAAMGCERVVLARELTLREIGSIAKVTETELEVFVHGAMCFSYSGLCLFSSFLGGKSGLRGRCVQPCRRRYSWDERGSGHKKKGVKPGGGYLFSMNDLSGLEHVPALKEYGIASLKIEGRLRSAHYVENVVRAYRLVIDAKSDQLDQAIREGSEYIDESMSRKVSSGYFSSPQPADAITPFHSGNMGLYLGQIDSVRNKGNDLTGRLSLKNKLHSGDRLRCHFESNGERLAFTVKTLRVDGAGSKSAAAGETVDVLLPSGYPLKATGRVFVYKVDNAGQSPAGEKNDVLSGFQNTFAEIRRKQQQRIQDIQQQIFSRDRSQQPVQSQRRISRKKIRQPLKKKVASSHTGVELWLKVDSPKVLFHKLPLNIDRFILPVDQKSVSCVGQLKKYFGKSIRNIIWSLPPILLTHELRRMDKLLSTLTRAGCRNFQIGHISQADLFDNQRLFLYGDYSLNLMNHQAVIWAETAGLEATQLSIELDRKCVDNCIASYKSSGAGDCRLGLTVYGTPPLFTSRLAPKHFQYNKDLKSPKGETFVIRKRMGVTQTFSRKPYSLIPYMNELQQMGLDYAVIDLSNLSSGKKELKYLADQLSGKCRLPKLPTFNYLGRLG